MTLGAAANIIDVIKISRPQPVSTSAWSIWKKNRVLVSRDPKLFWYFLGIAGILVQTVFMLGLAIWQIKKIYNHDYMILKSSVAVASLFLLFAIYLAINIWQTLYFRSKTLGGVLCCEILFLPVTYYLYYLFQSHRFLISLGLLLTIVLTIPIFFLRSTYCAQHKNFISGK